MSVLFEMLDSEDEDGSRSSSSLTKVVISKTVIFQAKEQGVSDIP